MEFLVTTELNLPAGVDPAERDPLFAAERQRGFELKRSGSIARIWRIPGAPWKTVSIRIADTPEALQDDLETLPVFHWLKVEVIALGNHPIDAAEWRMQFGIDIPNVHHGLGLDQYGGGEPFNATLAVNPATFRALAKRADEVGFHTVWLADHLVFPPVSASAHPLDYTPNVGTGEGEPQHEGTTVRADDPIFEALTTMAFIGALTERCRIGLGVLVIPYRNPVLQAKMLATIDVLTGGRVTIGAGVGWLQEAFAAAGADFAHRGPVTDEYIDLMRVLWRDDAPSFAGEHFTLEPGLRFLPKPVQQPGIPIFIGGVSKPALRRAATRGDGWLSVYQSPETFADTRATLTSLLAERGRSTEGFTFAMRVRYMVSDRDGGDQVCIGSPERIAEGIRAYHAAGCDHLQLAPPPGPTTASLVEQVDRFEAEVLPLVADLWATQHDPVSHG